MARSLPLLALILALSTSTGCKLRLVVNSDALVKGTTNWCLPMQLCVYQVSDTTLEEFYVGEGVSDELLFTHWQGGERRLCPNSPSPCHLSTAGFDQDPRLQAILDSDQVFFLEPVIQRIQNSNYPEAKPVQSEHDNYLIGEWKRDNQNGPRDTFALVANGNATVNLNMHDLSADMGLAILLPDPTNPLNQTPSPELVSNAPGLAEENLSLEVTSGEIYFIQVFPGTDDIEEASYSIHVELANEALTNQGPEKLAGSYALTQSEPSQSCNDSSSPEHPAIPQSLLVLNNQARDLGRPALLTFDSGLMAELQSAATRYDPQSGSYLDRASYTINDGSNDRVTWMIAGQFTEGGTFSGKAYSWGTYRSSNIRCASYVLLESALNE